MVHSKCPAASVGGVASSFLPGISCIGWKTLAFNAVLTVDGTLLDLSLVDPRTILRFLTDDSFIITGAKSDLPRRLGFCSDNSGRGDAPRVFAEPGQFEKLDRGSGAMDLANCQRAAISLGQAPTPRVSCVSIGACSGGMVDPTAAV